MNTELYSCNRYNMELQLCFLLRWCRNIDVYPRGKKDATGKSLSMYLRVSDSKEAPAGWARHAVYTLAVVNHKDPALSVSKGKQRLGP